ncbi:MAG: ribonuclease J [Patescibacteria group bacterium]|nr:ribonuclease J [Patescibacteria group bacterium]
MKNPPQTLKIIPLGGSEEVGKNCTVFEYGQEIIVLDLGLDFPTEETPGVDYIIPDVSYLKKNKEKIKAIVISHGHLDHIGAIPYIISEIGYPPIYGLPLTIGLIGERLEEFNLEKKVRLKRVNLDSVLEFKNFRLSFFHVNHNIPDSMGIVFETPVGKVVHTGDFKIDLTPTDQKPIDLEKIKNLGKQEILVLLSDSVNAAEPGKTVSEQQVATMIDNLFSKIKGRIIFTTFSTLITRIQELIKVAEKYGRRVVIAGLAMEKTCRVAIELGYLKVKPETLIWPHQMKKISPEKIVVLASGSQGMENSALSRISIGKHRFVKIKKGDTVIFSSSPIPGNERAIHDLMNNLVDHGAKVIYEPLFGIHASGHAQRDDLRLILSLIKPRYFVPAYGEHYMQVAHAEIAQEVGLSPENIFILNNGDCLEIDQNKIARLIKNKAPNEAILVDGLGVGDIKHVVLRDRKTLSKAGIFVIILLTERKRKIINHLEVVSRGFVFLKESEKLIKETKNKIKKITKKYLKSQAKIIDWEPLKNKLRNQIGDFLFSKTGRRPMILPIVIEI